MVIPQGATLRRRLCSSTLSVNCEKAEKDTQR